MLILYTAYQARPAPVTKEKLVHEMWGHLPDGGPDDPLGVLRVQSMHLNKRLKKLGLSVNGGGKARRDGIFIYCEATRK